MIPMENTLLESWDKLSEANQSDVAFQIIELLGSIWQFDGIETHVMGSQKHRIAFYKYSNEKFAFIPGATVTLGYDRLHPFIPNVSQQESWNKSRKDYKLPLLEEFLDDCMTPLRHVTIKPFLIEVQAHLYDISPEVEENGMTTKYMTSFKRKDALAATVKDNFRLPTSDEWEYACSAGTRTLFRWGNDNPMVDMPSPDEPTPVSDIHLRPNAFGLYIATFPYNLEYCTELSVMRGGDGGTALHAGIGIFAEWLTLASAFFDRPYEDTFQVYIRRVVSLPL